LLIALPGCLDKLFHPFVVAHVSPSRRAIEPFAADAVQQIEHRLILYPSLGHAKGYFDDFATEHKRSPCPGWAICALKLNRWSLEWLSYRSTEPAPENMWTRSPRP